MFGEELFCKMLEFVVKYGIKFNFVKIRGGFEDIGVGLEDLKVSFLIGWVLFWVDRWL